MPTRDELIGKAAKPAEGAVRLAIQSARRATDLLMREASIAAAPD